MAISPVSGKKVFPAVYTDIIGVTSLIGSRTLHILFIWIYIQLNWL